MDRETESVLQDLRNPQTCTHAELRFPLPRNRVVETLFYYREHGKPWHRHVHLVGGRAREAQVYPDKLVAAILKGLTRQMKQGVGCVRINSLEVGPVNQQDDYWQEDLQGKSSC